jgi:hypothetical protein
MVRPLPTRREHPADDAVVVIRAGVMSNANIERSAQRTFRRYGIYAISVEAALDGSVEETCTTSVRLAGYGQIRVSTFGRLRQERFALIATFERPHFSLLLADLTTPTLDRIQACFDPAVPNPAREARG